MVTTREENFPFSIESMTIFDYNSGEPYATRQFNGGNAQLNVGINLAMLDGADIDAPKRIEKFGGSISIDASVKEAPMEIINIANGGSLTTETACASAFIDNIVNLSGTSLSGDITGIAVSGGSHGSVIYDTIYIEVISTTTFKAVNYSKGTETGTLSVGTYSAAAAILDATVAPGIVLQASAELTPGDTLTFNTVPSHSGRKISKGGLERACSNTVYVGVKGVAKNCSDGDIYSFTLYKGLMTGSPSNLAHGEYFNLGIHIDGQQDDSLSTPAAYNIELLKSAKD